MATETTPADLNEDAAIAAVVTARQLHGSGAEKLWATKLYRDAIGCDVRTALAAIEWALPRSVSAVHLPAGSVVATDRVAWIRVTNDPGASFPWHATNGGHYSTAQVEGEIRKGAQVLRVGTGEG